MITSEQLAQAILDLKSELKTSQEKLSFELYSTPKVKTILKII